MQISEKIQQIDGVEKAAVVMATENNKKLIADMGLLTDELKNAGTNDFVISVGAKDETSLNAAISTGSFVWRKSG